MSTLEQALTLLRALGIVEVVYSLDGCGDSGTADLESVTYADGHEATEIPDFAVSFGDGGQVITLAGQVDDLVAELPEGDWVNNEGGYGTVTLRPMEEDEDRVECDMTFRADGDYGDGDEFDDEEFLDDDPEESGDEPAFIVGPITIAAEAIERDSAGAEEAVP